MIDIALIIRKEFRQIKADPVMIRLMVAPALVQLFVIGYALTTEVRHVPFAVVDRSATPQSVSLAESFKTGDLFDFAGYVQSESDLRDLLDRGTVRMGMVIPPDFAAALESDMKASVQLVVDGVDANSSQVASGFAQGIISRWSFAHLKERLRSRGIDFESMVPVRVDVAVLYNPLLRSSWFMIPGLVVLLVTIVTALLTGMSLVREKERGTLEQLMVTPIRPIALLIGKMIPFAIIGLVQVSVFMVLATLWFDIPFRGSLLTLFTFTVIFMLSSLSIGILTSTIARTTQQTMFLTFFVVLFFLLLSGLFIPVENMPTWVQTITFVNPVRFFITAVREMFLKGLGFADLWREAAIMGAIGVTMMGMALALFRRTSA